MLLLFLTVTSEDVCRNIRNVKLNEFLFSNMRFIVMFVTAVCVLFLSMRDCGTGSWTTTCNRHLLEEESTAQLTGGGGGVGRGMDSHQ